MAFDDRRALLTGLAAVGLGLTFPSRGQDTFPNRLIKLVVPVPPGASTDAIARLLGQRLSTRLKQTVVVENRAGGAGGNIGSESVAHAEPDGYTLLFAAAGPLAINQILYPKLGYDPSRWTPISLIATVDSVLVVRAESRQKSLAELIQDARANPGRLNYASGGSGTTAHMGAEMFKMSAGVDIIHVPYKGSVAALTGMLQGQVDMMLVERAAALQHVQSGRLRIIATGGATRSAAMPEVPAIAESLPGFAMTIWYGLVAPPQTPAPLVAALSGAVSDVMRSTDMVSTLQGLNINPVGSTPSEFQRFIQEEIKRWKPVITAAKIVVE
jgi:tripartite-type tricarboxylate transporter receptor subunit TctC